MHDWNVKRTASRGTATRAAVVSLLLILCCSAQGAVPNQRNVWVNGHWWAHVGNNTWRGSGGLNAFGAALQAADWRWTTALCQADTDGDGYTNGEELGDPQCVWVEGATPARTTDISHPGFASSIPATLGAPRAGTHVASCPLGAAADVAALANAERAASRLTTPIALPDGLVHGTKFSEVAAILPLDADTFAAEARATCPHLQSGLRHWHDASLWPGGALPAAGADVTIPANTRVLVSACSLASAGYAALTVPATSELIFADAPVHLRVKDIVVEGKLRLGSETCPLHSPVTITFYATKAEAATYGNGLLVTGAGELQAWGTRSAVTWTRLSATARRLSRIVLLQDAVDWGVGEEIVITTSIWRDEEVNQNELRRIVAVSNDGRVLVLDRPLNFSHYGGPEYQSEVGLLTRSVLFRGWTNGHADSYGGHTMAMGTSAIYKVVGVGAHRMGQRNVIARYPFHLHLMMEAAERATMQQLACHSCYYRCAVVHKTNSTVLRKSVAFNVSGHTYYLEEGAEMNNVIAFNLAAYVHPIGTPASGGAQGGSTFEEDPECTQPADHTAAGFYVPNPANFVYGNAASGGWSGFSFPIFEWPIKLSQDVSLQPYMYAVGRFDGNSAHSSGYYWGDAGCVYVGGKLWEENGKLKYSNGRFEQKTYWWPHGQRREAWHNVTNLRAWLCQMGYSSWGDRVDIRDFECHDCVRSAVLFGSSSVTRALVTGSTLNNPSDMETTGRQGFGFYDTWVKTVLSNVTFRNFHMRRGESKWQRNGVILDLTHSDIFKPWSISATKALRFENVDQALVMRRWVRETGASRMFNFIDWDGSVVGSTGCESYIIGSEIDWWAAGPGCFYRADWESYICPRVPGREPVGLDMELPGIQERLDIRTQDDDTLTQADRDRLYIGHISHFGTRSRRNLTITRNHHLATGLSGMGWYMYVKMGMPKTITIEPTNFPRGTYIVLAMSYPAGTTFQITSENKWGTKRVVTHRMVDSAQAVADSNGTAYHFDGRRLYLKILDYWIAYPNAYTRDGVDITSANQAGFTTVVANCPTTSGSFCAPPAQPEPPTADLTYPVTPCASRTDIAAPVPPLCPQETNVPPASFNGTCWDFRTNWGCTGKNPVTDCFAYCKPGCHQSLRPYTCSWVEPCDAPRKPAAARPWCEWLNDSPRSDVCVIASCNYATNATTLEALPSGSPCQVGDGLDGVCLGSGACRMTDANADPRGIEKATADGSGASASSLAFVAVGSTSASVSVSFADGASASGVATLVDSAGGAAPFFRFEVGGADRVALVRNVTVTNDRGASRHFRDWHGTISRVPRVAVQCKNATHVHVEVQPQNWVSDAWLENEANTTRNAAVQRTGSGFAFSVAGLGAGELRVRLEFAWGGTAVRTLPCHQRSGGEACRGAATTVRGVPSTCRYRLFDRGSNQYWVNFELSPRDDAATAHFEGKGLMNYQWGSYSSSVSRIDGPRIVTVRLGNGGVEYFRVTPAMLAVPSALECVNGTKPASSGIERGPAGVCTAESVCAMPGFSSPGVPPPTCTAEGAPIPATLPPATPQPVVIASPVPAGPESSAPNQPPSGGASPSTEPVASPPTQTPPVATAAPPTSAPVAVGEVRLRGDGFAALLNARRAELEAAVRSDLRRVLRLGAGQTLTVTRMAIGSLIVGFQVTNVAVADVNSWLSTALATDAAAGANSTTWPDTDALHRQQVPSAASSVSLMDYSAAEPPAATSGASDDSSGCARGCQIIIGVVAAVAIVTAVGVTLFFVLKKKPSPKSDPLSETKSVKVVEHVSGSSSQTPSDS